jgi:hypothetical protein
MKTHAQKADDLAEKLTGKAQDALAGIEREMIIMKWPAEFQAIMWDVVATVANSRKMEAVRVHQQSGSTEKSS